MLLRQYGRMKSYSREHRNSVVTSNHDQGRVVSKWGNDTPQWRTTSAKLLAILQSTQPGTLYVYRKLIPVCKSDMTAHPMSVRLRGRRTRYEEYAR